MKFDLMSFNKIVDTLPVPPEEKNKAKDGCLELGKFNNYLIEKLGLNQESIEALVQLQLGLRLKQKMENSEYVEELEKKFKDDDNKVIGCVIADSLSDFAKEQNYEQFGKLNEAIFDVFCFMVSLGLDITK